MPTPTKPITTSMAALNALACSSISVFHCAHHWVTDDSIWQAMLSGKKDDPAIPWTKHTHRARRIATIALMMAGGVRFPALRMHVEVTKKKGEPRHTALALWDGHHRLRAMQYLGMTEYIRFAVSGSPSTLIQKLADAKRGWVAKPVITSAIDYSAILKKAMLDGVEREGFLCSYEMTKPLTGVLNA